MWLTADAWPDTRELEIVTPPQSPPRTFLGLPGLANQAAAKARITAKTAMRIAWYRPPREWFDPSQRRRRTTRAPRFSTLVLAYYGPQGIAPSDPEAATAALAAGGGAQGQRVSERLRQLTEMSQLAAKGLEDAHASDFGQLGQIVTNGLESSPRRRSVGTALAR